jgi:hypothetical protein
MTDSIRQQIVAAVDTALKTIKEAIEDPTRLLIDL